MSRREEDPLYEPAPALLPDPSIEREKAWYGDADRVAAFMTTGLMITGMGFVIFFAIILAIKMAIWLL